MSKFAHSKRILAKSYGVIWSSPGRQDSHWAFAGREPPLLRNGAIDLNERIAIDPDIRGGKPCIRETRITVYDILEYMAGGMSDEEILADFPSPEAEDLTAVPMFAAQRERRLATGAPHEIAA